MFVESGKLDGGHWAATSDAGFFGRVVHVLYISLRILVFAIGTLVIRQSWKIVVVLLATFMLLDVVLSANRISALYFALALVLSGAVPRLFLAVGALIFAPFAAFMTLYYPVFRGVVWTEYGGFSGFSRAFNYVMSNPQYDKALVEGYFNLFEAGNIAVFQYIFENYGVVKSLLFGETVLLKPLAILVPRFLWHDKPLGLGGRLGSDLTGINELSLNSLMYGEFYANFGFYGCILGPVLCLLAILVFSMPRFSNTPVFHCAVFFLAFASWRHEFNSLFFGLIFLAPLLMGYYVVYRNSSH